MLPSNSEILFTRQLHEAHRAGRHFDIRLVLGDKAYSWATKKEMPAPGQSILLFEQPVHTASYALSDNIVIPDGQYGAGFTKLITVKKAKVGEGATEKQFTLYNRGGEKYLFKKLDDDRFGNKAWLFKRLDDGGGQVKEASENKYLLKLAEQKDQPHQERALAKLDKEKGLVVYHGMGSGKTKLMLRAIEKAQKESPQGRVFATMPAGLLHNFEKEEKKHHIKIDHKRLDIRSFDKAVIDAPALSKNKYILAIADEAHGLRNSETKRVQSLRGIIGKADKRILSTGTANYNDLSDLSNLVNIAAGDQRILPENKRDMKARYVEEVKKKRSLVSTILGHEAATEERLKNKKELGSVLNKYVDFYDPKDTEEGRKNFPRQTEETIEVEMSPEQHKYYKFMEGDLPLLLRYKIRHNLPLDKQEKASLNSFSTGVRQVSNSVRHLTKEGDADYTPKIKKAVENLELARSKNPRHKAIIYSNYNEAGIGEYSRLLKEKGIPHAIVNGKVPKKERTKVLEEYNSGKVPNLLISSAGGEGLDTKGTRQIQILEPHYNKSKLKQIIGRGVRFKSHEHLPESEREVHVEHYHSLLPKPMIGKRPTGIDTYLSENGEDKDKIFEEVKGLLRKKNDK